MIKTVFIVMYFGANQGNAYPVDMSMAQCRAKIDQVMTEWKSEYCSTFNPVKLAICQNVEFKCETRG